jgi:hypothetical protein
MIGQESDMRTDKRLMCSHRLTYDWNTRVGRLEIETRLHDQGGCVSFFNPSTRRFAKSKCSRYSPRHHLSRKASDEWTAL